MKYKDQGFKTHEKKSHNQIYTDTLLDSGRNFLIHIIKEVSTAITVNLQRHLYHYHEKKNNAQRQYIA